MDTHQLSLALQRHPETRDVFGGVLAYDQLPKSQSKSAIKAYVINTDPSYRPGQHWVAIYMTSQCSFYFDSYGLAPQQPPIKEFLRKRKKVVFYGRRLQGSGSMCGHYCLYFILLMQRKQRIQPFGDHYNANDRWVQKYVLKDFHVGAPTTLVYRS
jgi:hypothetical protein